MTTVHGSRFAPAERSDPQQLRQQVRHFETVRFTREILDAIPDPLTVLNPQRQIVFANSAAIALIDASPDLLYGRRPGEAFDCEHAWDCTSGCGTAEACRSCGIVQAILVSHLGAESVAECSFTQVRDNRRQAFDLRATIRPLVQDGENFTLLILKDIAHEKRRFALERIFFHDLMNSLGSVRGLLDLLLTHDLSDRKELLELAQLASLQAIDEIRAQREISLAESRELVPDPRPLAVDSLLEELVGIVQHLELAEGKTLEIVGSARVLAVTDGMLLRRILLNMVKNALEATPDGGRVTLGCEPRPDGSLCFRVNNPGVIPEANHYLVFQRSFSTKGQGRGLGTYSMRLLAGYLKGEVGFDSTAEHGTTFFLVCPQQLPQG